MKFESDSKIAQLNLLIYINIYIYTQYIYIYINMDYYFMCKYENTNLKFVLCAQREKIEHLMLYCKIREGMV